MNRDSISIREAMEWGNVLASEMWDWILGSVFDHIRGVVIGTDPTTFNHWINLVTNIQNTRMIPSKMNRLNAAIEIVRRELDGRPNEHVLRDILEAANQANVEIRAAIRDARRRANEM